MGGPGHVKSSRNLTVWPTEVVTLIQKQAKNRNETGSNLSLGKRLTVLSKPLGRKRCCDTTPDRCLEYNRLTMTAHCENKCYVFFQISRGFGGIPGPEAYQNKK